MGVSVPDFTDERSAMGLMAVQNLLSGLNCSGSEERLVDCNHDGLNVVPSGCNRAYVECIMEGRQNRTKLSVSFEGKGDRHAD